MNYKSGFVSVVGRPNVGKSTLINAIFRKKISIVTSKPQTTRHRILGIDTQKYSQVIYIDTPGIHSFNQKKINRIMNKSAINSLQDADVIFFLTEACKWTKSDEMVLSKFKNLQKPIFAILNKVDKIHPKELLFQEMDKMVSRGNFSEVIPLSARRREDVKRLTDLVPGYLNSSVPLFPEDMLTDQSEYFRYAEIIREKLMRLLAKELPYGLTVQLDQLSRDNGGLEIDAIIWVEKDSQKPIVIGKNGSLLKRVGKEARLEIKREVNESVHINLWVKVKNNWSDTSADLVRFGYHIS